MEVVVLDRVDRVATEDGVVDGTERLDGRGPLPFAFPLEGIDRTEGRRDFAERGGDDGRDGALEGGWDEEKDGGREDRGVSVLGRNSPSCKSSSSGQ